MLIFVYIETIYTDTLYIEINIKIMYIWNSCVKIFYINILNIQDDLCKVSESWILKIYKKYTKKLKFLLSQVKTL